MNIEKYDIRDHSNQELSLIVFNEEGLYRMRRNMRALLDTLNEYYIFNKEQEAVLKEDIAADLGEI